MELQTANSNVVNELPRCQKHTRNGRCRMLVADPSSPFCPEHARSAANFRRVADLSTLLTDGLTEFKSATPINDFLSRLPLHQAEGRIPPRRAAVMAYTCNLLLRTLPALEHEQKANEEPVQFIFDLPRPKRDNQPDPAQAARENWDAYTSSFPNIGSRSSSTNFGDPDGVTEKK